MTINVRYILIDKWTTIRNHIIIISNYQAFYQVSGKCYIYYVLLLLLYHKVVRKMEIF